MGDGTISYGFLCIKGYYGSKTFSLSSLYRNVSRTWIWTAFPSKQFTLTSAWKIVRAPAPIFDLFDMVWFPGHIPKMSCCVLRAFMIGY